MEQETLQAIEKADSSAVFTIESIIDKAVHMNVDDIISLVTTYALPIIWKIAVAIFIYIAGRWIIRRLLQLFDIAYEKRGGDPSLKNFLRSTIKVLCSILLILVVVATIGIDITSIIALFASASLAIGMALSGTARNLAGGAVVLALKPYRVGDYIEAQGQQGTVMAINMFNTQMLTFDNRTIYVPNDTISTSIIDNYSEQEHRRIDFVIGLSYGSDVKAARKVILGEIAKDKRVLTQEGRKASVHLVDLADSSINLKIFVWVKSADYWSVKFETLETIYTELPKHGFSFPFPQMDLYVKEIVKQ